MIEIFHAIAFAVTSTATFRKSIPFPSLAESLSHKAVPGTKLVSPPFEAGGSSWEVALYPFGVGDSYANRVGVYLKLAGKSATEVDATFALQLQVMPSHEAPQDQSTARGLRFECGMTFCPAREASESVGRCEDWGAHVIDSASIVDELLGNRACVAAVDVELRVWDNRPCVAGSGFAALREQSERLSRGCVRVGEVTVALTGGAAADTAVSSTATYRCVPGVEYRLLRITSAEGSPMFSADAASDPGSTIYLLPTSKAARGDDEMAGELAGARRTSNTVASILLDDDATGSSLPGARILRMALGQREAAAQLSDGQAEPPRAPDAATWGKGSKWPVAVPLTSLPPFGSRLSLRALPDRLAYAIRTSGPVVLLLAAIALWPIWGGFALSQLGSAYAIPSRSMEATLRIGDVVVAEKVSRIAQLPFEAVADFGWMEPNEP